MIQPNPNQPTPEQQAELKKRSEEFIRRMKEVERDTQFTVVAILKYDIDGLKPALELVPISAKPESPIVTI